MISVIGLYDLDVSVYRLCVLLHWSVLVGRMRQFLRCRKFILYTLMTSILSRPWECATAMSIDVW